MAAAIALPFLHPALVLVASGGFAGALLTLPPTRARPWLALAAGPGLAALLGALGVLPWTGTLHLAAHGACMLAGFVLAGALLWRRAPAIGLDPRLAIDACAIALVAGVVGARARYVWERWDRFALDAQGAPRPWPELLALAADVDGGGAVWYGGLILAGLAVVAWARWRRIPLLPLADLVAPAVLAGLAVGRLGCFFNGCCYGAPTGLPWGVENPACPGVQVHPAQLYESVVVAALAAGLWWWWPRRGRDGAVAFWAVVGYGCWRFINESLRGDHDVNRIVGLTPSQFTSLQLVAGALVVAGWRRWWSRRSTQDPRADIDKRA